MVGKRFYSIENGIISNTPVVDLSDKESVAFAQTMGWILGDLEFGIGDKYVKGEFVRKVSVEEIKRSSYEKYVQALIREKYSQDDENKILREYLADKTRSETEFSAYNAYVLDCKTRAHSKVYGEGVT